MGLVIHSRTTQNTSKLSIRLEKAMATHSSTLAWKIPWMETPGRLQSMGSWRVRHDWATSLSLFIFMHWRRKWQPTPVFLPGESQGWGNLVGAVSGVAQSQTRLKQLSSSSSKHKIQVFLLYKIIQERSVWLLSVLKEEIKTNEGLLVPIFLLFNASLHLQSEKDLLKL